MAGVDWARRSQIFNAFGLRTRARSERSDPVPYSPRKVGAAVFSSYFRLSFNTRSADCGVAPVLLACVRRLLRHAPGVDTQYLPPRVPTFTNRAPPSLSCDARRQTVVSSLCSPRHPISRNLQEFVKIARLRLQMSRIGVPPNAEMQARAEGKDPSAVAEEVRHTYSKNDILF